MEPALDRRAPRRSHSRPDDPMPALAAELGLLLADMAAAEASAAPSFEGVHPDHADGARNLVHYLALRARDDRPLQDMLARLGLSSLGRAEAHVQATVRAVLALVERARGATASLPAGAPSFDRGETALQEHAAALFGPAAERRSVRILVTLPAEAAGHPELVRALIDAGMDCARINTAHDDEPTWLALIEHVRRAATDAGRPCLVLLDLAGPKIRTGPLLPGPAVARIKPERDLLGRVTARARAWLAAPGVTAPEPGAVVLPVPEAFVAGLQMGDRLRFEDARGRKRELRVVERRGDGAWAETDRTAYVTIGTRLRLVDAGRRPGSAEVCRLPPVEAPIVLRPGDRLVLTRSLEPGGPALHDLHGSAVATAQIGCTPADVFADVRTGEPVWFDDGRIGGTVVASDGDRIEVVVRHASPGGSKLREAKGVHFPESRLRLPALTVADQARIDFAVRHADLVGLSFARRAADVEALQAQLAARGGEHLGILLKIETRQAFDDLPDLLLAALRSPRVGVMIARGDLAMECGFERLAEVQEEILWLCEAAHLPVVWATQVLDGLARTGQPTRAEITDAAMAERAECVMLNKGPYLVEAVRVLDDILVRMAGHQAKKRARLRPLAVARRFLAERSS